MPRTSSRGPRFAVAWVALGFGLMVAACGTSSHNDVSVPVPPTTKPPAPPHWVRLAAADGAKDDNLGGALWYDTFFRPVQPRYYATPGQAALSSNGTVALVGAPGHAGPGGAGAGAAYVFARTGSTWSQ